MTGQRYEALSSYYCLTSIAARIDASKNPSKELVARDLKQIATRIAKNMNLATPTASSGGNAMRYLHVYFDGSNGFRRGDVYDFVPDEYFERMWAMESMNQANLTSSSKCEMNR